jgi:hypothetical protein
MTEEENDKNEKKEDLKEILDGKTGIVINWGITIIFILAAAVLIYLYATK